ncbi:8323_t:CDS:1, partial [Funneliformis geosporum]
HDLYEKTASKAAEAMDIVMEAKFNLQSLSVCLGDQQPYAEQVTLPKSNPTGGVQGGNEKSPKGDNAKTPDDTEKPPVISANDSNSIKNNALLSIVCGLIMMIGTIYI